MFSTSVHSVRLTICLVCVLALQSALLSGERSVVFAQEPAATAEETPQEQSPYIIEGIPGGDAVVGDFVVGPGRVDLELKPGESRVVQISVTNRTGERRIFNVKKEDATGSSDVDSPIILLGDDRGPYSIKDYLSVPDDSFELGHNQRARIPVTISIPADAPAGGLYGSVLIDTVAIEATPEGETKDTVPQSAIIARIGTLFFITIPGDVEKEGALTQFGPVPEQTFFSDGPVNFGLLFENTGSIHLAPYGEIRVRNMLGDEVGFVELEPWFVLPDAKRLREISWDREFLIGRYTATAQINRSYDGIVDTATYSFWILPWKVLLVAFAGIFIVLFLIRTFLRTFEFRRKT